MGPFDAESPDSANRSGRVVLTRATGLQAIFGRLGKGASYGNSTTHHMKLWPRLEGGGGGLCPILTFATTPNLYVDDGPDALEAAFQARAARGAREKRITLEDLK